MRTRIPAKFTETVRAAYVEALAVHASHKAAAAHVGVHYATALRWRNRDDAFEAECKAAMGRHYDDLLAVARRWAVEGLVVETYDKAGNVTGKKRIHSERILLKMLARANPAAWGDKVQVDSKGTVEVHDKRIKTESMTPAQLRAARDFLKTIPDDPARN